MIRKTIVLFLVTLCSTVWSLFSQVVQSPHEVWSEPQMSENNMCDERSPSGFPSGPAGQAKMDFEGDRIINAEEVVIEGNFEVEKGGLFSILLPTSMGAF